MKEKKGLSTVVTTLIIILLVLVAVGIIWGVVSNLLNRSTGTIDVTTKCLDINLEVQSVAITDPALSNATYTVTLHRTPTGTDEIGAKINFFNATENSGILDFDELMEPLDTNSVEFVAISGVTYIEYTPYFLDTKSNTAVLCPNTQTFEFS